MEDRYRCPQCKERFQDSGDKIPKLLPACLHTVCLACLSDGFEKHKTLRCPIDSCDLENSTKLPDEGLKALPSDFLVLDGLPLLDSMEDLSNDIHCDCCDQTEVAISYCLDCNQFLCEFHVTDHRKRRKTKAHQLRDLAQLRGSNDVNVKKLLKRPVRCAVHTENLLEIYCETCECPTCIICALLDHSSHTIIQGVSNQQQDLRQLIEKVDVDINMLQRNKQKIETLENECQELLDASRKEINGVLNELVSLIETQRQKLLSNVEEAANENKASLSEIKSRIESTVTMLRGNKAFANRVAEEGDNVHVSLTKSVIIERLEETEGLLEVSEHPKPIMDYFVTIQNTSDIKSAILRLGECPICISSTKVLGTGLERALMGQDAEFIISLFDVCGKPMPMKADAIVVVAEMAQPNIGQVSSPTKASNPRFSFFRTASTESLSTALSAIPMKVAANIARVEAVDKGKFRVVYRPTIDGLWKISITVDDESIPGSPFMVTVKKARKVHDIKEPIRVINSMGRFSAPEGLFLDRLNEILYVASSTYAVSVLKMDGSLIRTFGCSAKPNGLAADDNGNVVVVCADSSIRTFSSDGSLLNLFGSFGKGPGQFIEPCGIALNKKEKLLYITDLGSHRVSVFKTDGTFMKALGDEGAPSSPRTSSPRATSPPTSRPKSRPVSKILTAITIPSTQSSPNTERATTSPRTSGPHNQPFDVAIHPHTGEIVVSECGLHRLHIYDSNGQFVRSIGSRGSGKGEFYLPTGITIDNEGNIFVSDTGNKRVQVFNWSGTYIHSFSAAAPRFIDSDLEGNLFVSDKINSKIYVF
eukprot:TRINITY_DN3827_c0_g1_i1.p1 TRINITY_DN3827_c0_g1~~TRINITY_DN3827_c0_g1_i1.p1  ORF type:complete len:816 (-),score=177.57 TRINITY_DN3827_c0_g1_i1:136-2583(-)